MRKFLMTACVVIAGLSFSAPTYAGDNSFWGTGIGAAMGGLVGSQFGRGTGQLAATGLGVFLGGAVGHSVGSSMDRVDHMGTRGYSYDYPSSYAPYYAYEPTYVAPPTALYPPQRRVIYVQPPEVIEYREATPAYVQGGYVGGADSAPSRYCREYTQKVRVEGRIQESYGTACLQPDGTWQIER